MQSFDISPAGALEQILWGLSFLSVIFMLIVMPWVGPDGILTGTEWLGLSLAGILLYGGAALVVRLLNSQLAEQYDDQLDQSFQNFNR